MKNKKLSLFGAPVVCYRTSNGAYQPCKEAKLAPYVYVDRRITDDPMKNPYIGAKWYEDGYNHRVENGQIARNFDRRRWVVEFKDSLDLQRFCEKYGELILSIDNSGTEPCFRIEIYDDYRE